ncbi:IS200/IS605 family transposase, partial (plasmid) [Clostridium perfringens]
IKNQIQEDIAYEQISLKEYIDPFTGEPIKKNR